MHVAPRWLDGHAGLLAAVSTTLLFVQSLETPNLLAAWDAYGKYVLQAAAGRQVTTSYFGLGRVGKGYADARLRATLTAARVVDRAQYPQGRRFVVVRKGQITGLNQSNPPLGPQHRRAARYSLASPLHYKRG